MRRSNTNRQSGRRRLAPYAAAVALLFGGAVAASAQDGPGGPPPLIEGEILFELQNDYAFDSDDPSAEINDLFTTIEGAFALNLSEVFSVQSLFVLEPVRDPRPFDDRYFGDHGLFVEELYAQAQFDYFRIFAGKFDASFGTAWDKAPGIYGVDFAEDYELVERIGGGVAVSAGQTLLGDVTATANVFFADISALSESAITNRGRNRKSLGGASNTNSLESFSVTLDGENVPGLPGVVYHVGYRHQAAGTGDAGDEDGVVAGLQKAFDLGNDLVLETIVEGVYLDNAFGGPDDTIYFTAGGALISGPWNLSTSFTLRDTDVVGGTDLHDKLAQVSAGYAFENGLTADVGYRYSREARVETHIFGFLMTYVLDVNKGLSQLTGL